MTMSYANISLVLISIFKKYLTRLMRCYIKIGRNKRITNIVLENNLHTLKDRPPPNACVYPISSIFRSAELRNNFQFTVFLRREVCLHLNWSSLVVKRGGSKSNESKLSKFRSELLRSLFDLCVTDSNALLLFHGGRGDTFQRLLLLQRFIFGRWNVVGTLHNIFFWSKFTRALNL